MLKVEVIARQQGKTQTELATASGVNRVIINRIIRGREIPSEAHAKAIASALDWPIERASELFEEIAEVR